MARVQREYWAKRNARKAVSDIAEIIMWFCIFMAGIGYTVVLVARFVASWH
jgi:hypothetical protein